VINVALHIQHWDAAIFGDIVEVDVSFQPIAMANGNSVEVSAENLANLFGCVAVGDLGGLGVNESAPWPPSWAIPASKEPRVRVLLKKNSIANTLSLK
jgi:hypothetical protein